MRRKAPSLERSLADVHQGDFFANRQTVGTENEIVMIARFEAPPSQFKAQREEEEREKARTPVMIHVTRRRTKGGLKKRY